MFFVVHIKSFTNEQNILRCIGFREELPTYLSCKNKYIYRYCLMLTKMLLTMDNRLLIFSDIWNENRAAVRVFVLFFAFTLLFLQKFIQKTW